MARAVRGEIRPVVAVAKPPMILNLLGQDTDREPMRSLMAAGPRGGAAAGHALGQPDGRLPLRRRARDGPGVIAVADGDRAAAQAVADELAGAMWDVRERAVRRLPDAGGGGAAWRLASATEARRSCSSTWATTSAAAPRATAPCCSRSCSGRRRPGLVVALYAPDAVAAAKAAGVGGRSSAPSAARSDRLHGDPVRVRGVVRSLHDGKWVEDRGPARRPPAQRPGARRPSSTLDGGNLLVLNSLRTPPFSLGQLTSLGIDPQAAGDPGRKAAVAYKAAYAPIAGRDHRGGHARPHGHQPGPLHVPPHPPADVPAGCIASSSGLARGWARTRGNGGVCRGRQPAVNGGLYTSESAGRCSRWM